MTTYPNMSLVLPTRGAPGSGHWADTLDADLALLDAHDHTTGKGLPIRSAALSIDGDVSFGSNWAATALQRITFASVTALSSNNKSLFVSSADNELYWRSNAGSNVKLTSGSALNVSAFTGGIAGDYTAVGAQVAFDDSGDRYTFKQNSATGWARLASGEVRILETGTTETVYVGLAAPAALAASYTLTWPLAVPSGTRSTWIDSSGNITLNPALALVVPASAAAAPSGSGATLSVGSFLWTAANLGDKVAFPIALLTGQRITSVVIWYQRAGGTLTFDLRRATFSSGAVTSVQSTTVNTGTSLTSVTLSSVNHTVLSTDQYILEFTAGATSDTVRAVIVNYDFP